MASYIYGDFNLVVYFTVNIFHCTGNVKTFAEQRGWVGLMEPPKLGSWLRAWCLSLHREWIVPSLTFHHLHKWSQLHALRQAAAS